MHDANAVAFADYDSHPSIKLLEAIVRVHAAPGFGFSISKGVYDLTRSLRPFNPEAGVPKIFKIETGNGAKPKTDEMKPWDEAKLKADREDFARLLNFPVSDITGPAPANRANAIASNSGTSGRGSSTQSAVCDWGPFVPEDRRCGVWKNSPNKYRYASFGDGGTTASANCYGDLIQMSQHMHAGRSGVFTIDDTSVEEPYYVERRAQGLENFSSTSGFGLYMPPESGPDDATPPEVKWVNWRWPRYEYTYISERGTDVKACFQYMVHKGVVLQQFTLENTGNETISIGPFSFVPNHLIRDLDFLEDDYPFNQHGEESGEYHYTRGPNDYGHVYVHKGAQDPSATGSFLDSASEPPTNESSAVASVITIFVDGSATKVRHQDNVFLDKRDLGVDSKFQIVIAYKLFPITEAQMTWSNFVVSAKDANINHWLREESKCLWDSGDNTAHCVAGLALSTADIKEDTATGDEDHAASEERTAYTHSKDHSDEIHEIHENSKIAGFEMPSGTPTKSSNPMNHLDYLAWRHLEHILSVCAIPLSDSKAPQCEKSDPAIALTCGDMCGHRINTSASFFAFKFLVDVALRLQSVRLRRSKSPVNKFLAVMEDRIKDTCNGHIRWLRLLRTKNEPEYSGARTPPAEERLRNDHVLQAGCFAANYWITGNVMTENTWTWMPENSMTDTALQILKIEEYKKLFPDPNTKGRSIAQVLLDDLHIPFLTELNKLDIRETFTWPHRKTENINSFRLDDHFWIWKALNFLHTQATKILPPPRRDTTSPELTPEQNKWIRLLYIDSEKWEECDKHDLWNKAIREFLAVAKRLSPINVQRGILQRFTTLEDASQERMLAVTRSAGQTRFLLHARDIMLLYGEDNGFFPENSPSRQLWDNTKRAQLRHEENLNAEWDITLRYALGIAMGLQNCTLNASSATELVKRCVRILISSSGSDAFFPGFLDELGNEPTNFGDERYRDSFCRAGFEIHYVLLSSAHGIATRFHEGIERAGSSKNKPGTQRLAASFGKRRRAGQNAKHGKGSSVRGQSDNKATQEQNESRQTLLMKKFSPFTNTILATNCHTFKDEWLYKYPDFLRSGRIDIKHVDEFISKDPAKVNKRPKDAGFIIGKTIEGLVSQDPASSAWHEFIASDLPEQTVLKLCAKVVDREKKKHLGRGQKDDGESETPKDLYGHRKMLDYLGSPRSALNAKKRLIGLRAADLKTAFVSWLVSPERERQPISEFFDRHARCDKDVLDRTSLVFNEWQTELHLSFYVLVKGPVEGGTDLLSVLNRESSMPFPGSGKQKIRRASISFRFDGDFFDRYWTCHFIESVPVAENLTNKHVFDDLGEDYLLKPRWQRKVLELYFLNQMLERIVRASKIFPTQVREALKLGGSEAKSLVMEKLLEVEEKDATSMKRWQEFERILHLVEEDLSSVLKLLQKWNRRERDRGNEQPRWTQNDEKKYRTTINKLHGQTQITTADLEVSRDTLRKLREFLAASRKSCRDKLERIQADRDRTQNEYIRYFTYSTVIFLPLGFATSFYSMGGPPDHNLIASLVEFAAAAFTATFFLILGFTYMFKKLESKRGFPYRDETPAEPAVGYAGQSQEPGLLRRLLRRRPRRMRTNAVGEEPDGTVQTV